jgi:RNA polymerase sigma-70 factor (ECF subfamily)
MILINKDDAVLVNQFKTGSESAFKVLLERHSSKVYTSIFFIVKDRYIAEDILQEVFIKAIDKIKSGKYNESGKFGPWIGRIAHNMAIDYFRKQKRSPELLTEDGSNIFCDMNFKEESIEDIKIMEDNNAALKSLINKLPEAQRTVLTMRHFCDMSFQEISEETGVSINTALGRMRYALLNLRKMLEESELVYDKNYYSQ